MCVYVICYKSNIPKNYMEIKTWIKSSHNFKADDSHINNFEKNFHLYYFLAIVGQVIVDQYIVFLFLWNVSILKFLKENNLINIMFDLDIAFKGDR